MTAHGTLESIWRYPVKSLGGERVDTTMLDRLGVAGDRRFGLRDVETGRILSAKQTKVGEALLAMSASLDGETLWVDLDGERLSARTDRARIDARCSELLGRPVRLVEATDAEETYDSDWPDIDGLVISGQSAELPLSLMTGNGAFVDLAALHLVTTAGLEHLAALAPGSDVAVERFRPSFVVATPPGTEGFVENDWIGGRARIGEVELDLGGPTPRCAMVTRAQPGLDADLGVLRSLARHNRLGIEGMGDAASLGIYAEVTRPGPIAVGDTFELL